MKVTNLTPHAIRLNNGTTYPPSGSIATIPEEVKGREQTNECWDYDRETGFKEVSSIRFLKGNLPPQVKGELLIVSSIVAMQHQDREDLIIPITRGDNVIRNEKGHIVSVPGFKKYNKTYVTLRSRLTHEQHSIVSDMLRLVAKCINFNTHKEDHYSSKNNISVMGGNKTLCDRTTERGKQFWELAATLVCSNTFRFDRDVAIIMDSANKYLHDLNGHEGEPKDNSSMSNIRVGLNYYIAQMRDQESQK